MKRNLLIAMLMMVGMASRAFAYSCGEGCETNEPNDSIQSSYLSPTDYAKLAQTSCSGVEGLFLTNQTQACNDALSQCKAEYLNELQSACSKTVDYYGDTYLTCSETILNEAKVQASSHHLVIGSACSLLDGQNQWPSSNPSKVSYFPARPYPMKAPAQPNFPQVNTVDPVLPGQMPSEPTAPELPKQEIGDQPGADANAAAPNQSEPSAENAMVAGGGCSLQITHGTEFSWSALVLCALIGTFSAYIFLRKKK